MRKVFLIISITLFLVLGIKTYEQYKKIEKSQNIMIEEEIKILSSFIQSFRKTYQEIFTEENIDINENTLKLLPVKSINEIVDDFSKRLGGGVVVRTVSDRPRNIQNKANKEELKVMKYFTENPKAKSLFKKGENSYTYSVPLKIKESCLKCHGKKEETLPIIRKKYSNAYNYKVGDLRGLINITVKKDDVFTAMHTDYIKMVLMNSLLYLIIIMYIYYLLKKLEDREILEKKELKRKIKEATKELEDKQKVLDHQAHHDSLTELPNRALFNDRLDHSVKLAKRKNTKIAVFFFDLDHFKDINDSLGHHMGDKVLKNIADKLKNTIRSSDTLARLGGDEFTVIAENIDENGAATLAKKILEELDKPIFIEGKKLYVSSSIGISIYPDNSDDKDNLLKYADAAMYSAKEEGRGTFKFYSEEMTKASIEKIQIEAEIRTAIQESEFEIYYQPQINSIDGSLVGVEGLIRWNHPTKGFLSPFYFMDISERSNLVVDIDDWMMKKGMTQMKCWQDKGYKTGKLSLNLSVRQLMSKDFLKKVTFLMKDLQYSPDFLELEISEKTIIENPKEAIKKLKIIRDKYIDISIDDFGKGYASLSYLKDLPLNKVKIDKSFVDGLPSNKEDAAIVKAIIELSKSLDLKIIAEGVEEKEQMEFLRDNGCPYIQGYYYDKPLSADEFFEKYLKPQKKD